MHDQINQWLGDTATSIEYNWDGHVYEVAGSIKTNYSAIFTSINVTDV